MSTFDEFGEVFPGSSADGLKAAAAAAGIGLDANLWPASPPGVKRLEELLVDVSNDKPDHALLAFCLAISLASAAALTTHVSYARYLCEASYEFQLRHQRSSGKRIHKGAILHQLGLIYSVLGDSDGAFRWFSLAHLEDCVSRADADARKNGMAFNVLRTRYAVRMVQFERLWSVVDKLLNKQNKDEREKLAIDYPDVLYLLVWVETGIVAPLSRTTTEFSNWTLLEQLLPVLKGPDDADGKMAELWLALYFFGAAALEVRTNVWITTREYEFDVLVASGLDHVQLSSSLGTYFAGEAKNWMKEVGPAAVNHFAAKLMFHDLSLGVLLAKKNVTGGDKVAYRSARKTLLKLAHSHGVHVLIWDEDDLQRLVDERLGSLSALRVGYEQARFEFGGKHA